MLNETYETLNIYIYIYLLPIDNNYKWNMYISRDIYMKQSPATCN